MVPPALRVAWEAETRAQCRQGAETACRLAIPLVPLFGLLDWAVFRHEVRVFFALRLVCVVIVVLIRRLLRTSFGERHALGLGVLVTTVCGLMVDIMTLFTGREASPYYAGVNLVQCAIALLMPWSVAWSVFASGVLVGGYALLTVASGPILQTHIFINNLAFLGATAAITIASTAFRERLRVREFVSRMALGEALRAKSEFLAKMSHELRTPIHVVVGYADILLEEWLAHRGAEGRRLVQKIREHGVRLHHLISELLDYAKVEAGKMDVRAESVRVPDVVERVADSFRPLTERKGVRLDTQCSDLVPEIVSDGRRLEQILMNLVGNAVKFTERGRIILKVRLLQPGDESMFTGFTFLDDPTAALAGPAAERGPRLAVFVCDTGLGIRDADLARLAADFAQVDGTAEKYGGTGLGLSISRKLAQLLGGRVAVRSRVAEGSTFALVLPIDTTGRRIAA